MILNEYSGTVFVVLCIALHQHADTSQYKRQLDWRENKKEKQLVILEIEHSHTAVT